MNAVSSFRVISDVFPISQKAKKTHPELNFDMDWGVNECSQYTIDDSGYFCQEEWKMNKETKQHEIASLKRMNITQQVKLETDIEGKPAKFTLDVEEGRVVSIKRL